MFPVMKEKVIYFIIFWFCSKSNFTYFIFSLIKALIQTNPKWRFKHNYQATFYRHFLSLTHLSFKIVKPF